MNKANKNNKLRSYDKRQSLVLFRARKVLQGSKMERESNFESKLADRISILTY